MQSSEISAEQGFLESNLTSYLNVLIAYQDADCNQRAVSAFDALVSLLGPEYVLAHSSWKFDLFGFPKMREMAARDALQADLIIICAREEDELPAEVDAWTQEWAPLKTNQPCALIALFELAENSLPCNNSTKIKLEEIAKKANMAFFSESLELRETGINCLKELTQRL